MKVFILDEYFIFDVLEDSEVYNLIVGLSVVLAASAVTVAVGDIRDEPAGTALGLKLFVERDAHGAGRGEGAAAIHQQDPGLDQRHGELPIGDLYRC